jgi:phosphatidylserine decarboxylase
LEEKAMKLAQGSLAWLIPPAIGVIIFGFISLFSNEELQTINLFLMTCILMIFFFFLVFFRDPHRPVGNGIVAVADGRIRTMEIVQDTECGRSMHISTFMNVYNVHVNRCPYDGIVKKITHHPGSHIPAFKKESNRNERVIILLETSLGMMKIIQIAGTLARRIVPYIKEGDILKKGDRIGLIRLGSRVDVFIPGSAINTIPIKPKQMVQAGVNSIATIND